MREIQQDVRFTVPPQGIVLPRLGHTLPPGLYRGTLVYRAYPLIRSNEHLAKVTIEISPSRMKQAELSAAMLAMGMPGRWRFHR
jgi:hypothetical protein